MSCSENSSKNVIEGIICGSVTEVLKGMLRV